MTIRGKVGISTTIPVEVILAANCTPVDINNIFIGSDNSSQLVSDAELAGYPRNVCGWIKGIYSTVLREGISTMIAVTQGDCSQTQALMETLELRGVKIIPFGFPYDRDRALLELQIRRLMDHFGVSLGQVNEMKSRLDEVRRRVAEIDSLTWENGRVSGWENHFYQVSCSDFMGNVDTFAREVEAFLSERASGGNTESSSAVRIGYIGVPPIVTDLYEFIEQTGARIVYNEVQRQFAMPFVTQDIVEQYRLYTYPYSVFGRMADIKAEIQKRKIAGIIHYVQSFCFRQIEDMIFREKLGVPIITLEGDRPGKLDARTKLRLEAFVEMLKQEGHDELRNRPR